MRAAVCHGAGQPLVIETLDLAAPGRGEVQVRVEASAICHSDITYAKGLWGDFPPTVFGHEVAGTVEAVGAGVSHLKEGDRAVVTLIRTCGACAHCTDGTAVMCETRQPLDEASPLRNGAGNAIGHGLRTGGFAERVTVHASQAVAIPADIPVDSASVIACAVITGMGAVLNTAAMPEGRHVVVIGTGGVGLNSLQAAALRRPKSLTAVDIDDAKLAVAQAFGASDVVNGTAVDVAEAVREITGGHGADYVFVTVGNVRAMTQAFPLLARSGTLVLVGMPPDGVELPVDPNFLAGHDIRLLGSKMGSARIDRDVPQIVSHYRAGRLKLDELISGRFRLEQINEAIADAERPDTVRNVILF